jgi:hypothetical protein
MVRGTTLGQNMYKASGEMVNTKHRLISISFFMHGTVPLPRPKILRCLRRPTSNK